MSDPDRIPDPDPTPDLVPLISVRTLCAAEPDEASRWQEGLIKRLTEGEPCEVRALNEKFFEANPAFPFRIRGRDDAGSGDPEQ